MNVFNDDYSNVIVNPVLKECDNNVIEIFMKNKPKVGIKKFQAFNIKTFMNPDKKYKDHEVKDKLDALLNEKETNNTRYELNNIEKDITNYNDNDLNNMDYLQQNMFNPVSNSNIFDEQPMNVDLFDKFNFGDTSDHGSIKNSDHNRESEHGSEYNYRPHEYTDNKPHEYTDNKPHEYTDNKKHGYKRHDPDRSIYNMTVEEENNDKAIRLKKRAIMQEFARFENMGIFTHKRFTMDTHLADLEDELEALNDQYSCNKFIAKSEIVVLFTVFMLETVLCRWGYTNMKGWFGSVKDSINDYHNDFVQLYYKYKGSVEMGPEMSIIIGIAFSGLQFGFANSDLPSKLVSSMSTNNSGGFGDMITNMMSIFGGGHKQTSSIDPNLMASLMADANKKKG